jgi:hypothetical protein
MSTGDHEQVGVPDEMLTGSVVVLKHISFYSRDSLQLLDSFDFTKTVHGLRAAKMGGIFRDGQAKQTGFLKVLNNLISA